LVFIISDKTGKNKLPLTAILDKMILPYIQV